MRGVYGGKKGSKGYKNIGERYATDKGLIQEYALRLGISFEDAKFFIDEAVNAIANFTVAKGACNIRGFGLFYLQPKKNAKYKHPKTGEEIRVPLRYMVRFRSSSNFRSSANRRVRNNLQVLYDVKEKNTQ